MILTHDIPDDLDIALVSPEGGATILMADDCASGDLGAPVLHSTRMRRARLPERGELRQRRNVPAGGWEPGWWADNWPAPARATGRPTSTTFVGGDPNGQWRLFVVDDAVGQLGSIQSWSMLITTEAAQIADPGRACDRGHRGSLSVGRERSDARRPGDHRPNVTFNDLNHMHPDDIDMVIQGPGGRNGDAHVGCMRPPDMHDMPWQFDTMGELCRGTTPRIECKQPFGAPTAFGDIEDLPAPAPAGPYGSSLIGFDGLQGGDWRLWINDDSDGDTGWINGGS